MGGADARTEGSTAHPRGSGPSERADLVGQTIAGTYSIERRIGSGGMGVVYLARHAQLGYPVAIKCVHPDLARDATVARRFVQETQAAAQIRHDHVVQILERGQLDDGSPYIVMEYLDGEALAAVLDREGPLPWRRAAHIARQIASALVAAHEVGIVHRDIKPANCLRLRETAAGDLDTIKVLDFGLARLAPGQQGESLTSTGVVMGTPGYIAPEVYRGFRADARADIYALGVLTYRLLEDDLPPFKVPDTALARVPSSLRAVILRCIHHDPEGRYASAEQAHDALVQLLHVPTEGPTIEEMMAPTPAVEEARRVILEPPTPTPARTSLPTPASGTSVQALPRRRRRWAWAAGAALLAVAAVVALNFGGPPVDRVAAAPAGPVGTLMIELSPAEATVTIDGAVRPETGARRLARDLPAGPHRVEVTAGAAYLPFMRDVHIGADQIETLTADLQAREVAVHVATEPANAAVRIVEGDGARVYSGKGGETIRVERKPGVPYKVIAELAGYGSTTRPLVFSGKSSDRVRVELIKDRAGTEASGG